MNKKLTLFALIMVISVSLFSQTPKRQPDYNVNQTKSTNNLQINPISILGNIANYLSGPGVSITNVKFNGNDSAIIGSMIGYFEVVQPALSFGIDTGIIISTGGVMGALGGNSSFSTTTPTGSYIQYHDSTLLSLIPNHTLVEAAVLEFDFTPLTDTLIACKFVFASEEYPEFVNTQFNDVFGFFISGPNPSGGMFVNKNLALIPGTNSPITIDSVNANTHPQYYVDNNGGGTMQYDGYTTPIILQQVVTPGQTYHFKVGVADAGDAAYDSGVFMKIKSFYGYASMPIANFSFSISGNMVTFNNTTNWAKYYVWNFGDGATDTTYDNSTPITHFYNDEGIYTVSIEAHNYYQINTKTLTIQIGNEQGIAKNNGSTYELIPLGDDNSYQLNISLNQPENVSIYITDISGKKVQIIHAEGQKEISQIIRLSGLAKGVYILQVKTKENTFVRKVINK